MYIDNTLVAIITFRLHCILKNTTKILRLSASIGRPREKVGRPPAGSYIVDIAVDHLMISNKILVRNHQVIVHNRPL